MNKFVKKLTAIVGATSVFALCGCQQEITVTFDSVRPWHDGELSYERLVYAAEIFDTTDGADEDTRVRIAEGELSFALEELVRSEGSSGYSTLDMDFYVTYNDSAAEADKGKTDTIQSSTRFQTDSLVTSTMTKTVTLADRDGRDNLSYTLVADYFGTHKATRTFTSTGDEVTINIPQNAYFDNEMMYHLTRATSIGKGASTNFYMTNMFDSCTTGKFTRYTMSTKGDEATHTLDFNKWIEPWLVTEPDEENGEQAEEPAEPSDVCKVDCTRVSISINDSKSGPPYYVYFAEKSFTDGTRTHKKVPVKITYAQYTGSRQVRMTEYTLSSISFEKP